MGGAQCWSSTFTPLAHRLLLPSRHTISTLICKPCPVSSRLSAAAHRRSLGPLQAQATRADPTPRQRRRLHHALIRRRRRDVPRRGAPQQPGHAHERVHPEPRRARALASKLTRRPRQPTPRALDAQLRRQCKRQAPAVARSDCLHHAAGHTHRLGDGI
jgi:hypothetical protein